MGEAGAHGHSMRAGAGAGADRTDAGRRPVARCEATVAAERDEQARPRARARLVVAGSSAAEGLHAREPARVRA